ncbi:MAG: HEAT repeat domain-containing protein [Acidobacteriota bacterium]|nr:HEAT repeat domain-containing protein [Acidobacteriota bacterium]
MEVAGQNANLKPTPDYGSLGTDADLHTDRPITAQSGSRKWVALAAGAFLGMQLMLHQRGLLEIVQFLSKNAQNAQHSSVIRSGRKTSPRVVTNRALQSQAELLLQRAVGHSPGAKEEVAARVDAWRGNLTLTPQLNSLITSALNSDDFAVRAEGIEVDLAAMGLAKTPESAEQLILQASTGPKSQRIWALWTMGLLGNRDVEAERIGQFLTQQLGNDDPEIRQWAVEGISYLGTDGSIDPLMKTFHDDPSPMVRERAACGLAQSGMLSKRQRQTIIPRLLLYASDPSLDASTHGWVFQALRDITAQSLPNDAAAWQSWYDASSDKVILGSAK